MTLLTSITCEQPAQIEVAGYTFVTTGMFRNDRLALERFIGDLGGVLKGHCSRYSDYLIVGEDGPSSIWKYRNYGTKLERAVKLKAAGYPLQIVMETDFLRAACRQGIKQCFHSVNAINRGWRPMPALVGSISGSAW